MPQVRFTPSAVLDLKRLREFLEGKNPVAARKASAAIKKAILGLRRNPRIGRPAEKRGAGYRELIIELGVSGYIALYRDTGKSVIVMAIRHQKETGYD